MPNLATNSSAPEPEPSHLGWILTAGILGMLVIWTYILFGVDGVQWWGKLAASVAVVFSIVFAWRWRRQRLRKQLEVLERWAENEERRPVPLRFPSRIISANWLGRFSAVKYA